MDFKAQQKEDGPLRRGRILVVGASGRMTAAMLSRLGFDCSVADLFADHDTKMICDGKVTKLSHLNDLHLHEHLVRSHDFVVFAGGLEGHIEAAETVCDWSGRAFASPKSLRQFNDHTVLNQVLKTAGADRYLFQRNPTEVAFPAIAKSLSGSGKARMVASRLDCLREGFCGQIFQNKIDGQVVSQIFVGDGQTAKVLGGSTQRGAELSWIGSISGLALSAHDEQRSIRVASSLVELTGIQGVFGIDFVQNEDGLWPIDFNPRIPASAEIIGDHVLQEHMNSFGVDAAFENTQHIDAVQGKQVVFNTTGQPFQFCLSRISEFPFRHQSKSTATSIADIPAEGETIQSGRPILTIFVSGKCATKVESLLDEKSREILDRLSL